MMNRLVQIGALALFITSAFFGCSMLGRQTDFAEAVTSSGVGPFRTLLPEELGGADALAGMRGVGRAVEIPGALFFDRAASDEFDPDLYRALPHELGCASYRGKELVLSPELPWEGARLFDPFVLVRDDGGLDLYYAGEGGIGLARSERFLGAFSRVGEGPILEGPRRSPSVIRDEELGEILYFEEAGRIHAARRGSPTAGLIVEEAPLLPLIAPFSNEPQDDEIAHTAPFAIVGEMPSGRRTVRLYFTSIRASGERHLMMAASEDGVRFERSPFPIVNLANARAGAPSVRHEEEGIVHLVYIEDAQRGLVQRAVSPPETRLFGHPDHGDACDP